jgi:hypothetical protein
MPVGAFGEHGLHAGADVGRPVAQGTVGQALSHLFSFSSKSVNPLLSRFG